MDNEKRPIHSTAPDQKTTSLSAKEEYEQLRAQSKKLKKRMIAVFAILLVAILALLATVLILDSLNQPQIGIPDGTYQFEPTYQGDIMENAEYLGKDRLVYYYENPNGDGLRLGITEENKDTFDLSVQFLCDWLDTIVAGDASAYNNFFTEQYWIENEKEGNMKKTYFSPQMIYDIDLFYQSQTSENGEKRVTYKLEYHILHNDGTFRKDIGSRMSRTQYVTVREVDEDTYLIDELRTVYPVVQKEPISITAVLLVFGGVAVIIGSVVFAVLSIRSKKKKVKEHA